MCCFFTQSKIICLGWSVFLFLYIIYLDKISITKNDSVKELAQSPVANDGTVNFLHRQPLKYAKNLVIYHFNINLIRNKFLDFKELVISETDVSLISETKLDDSFPNQQFHVNWYKMFRKDFSISNTKMVSFGHI